MLKKYIDFRFFFISLAFGLLVVYIYQPDPTVVYVYPTPSNINNVQLKDKAENCFKFTSTEVNCPEDKSLIHNIPVQSEEPKVKTSMF